MVKYGHAELDNVESMRTSVGLLIAATTLFIGSCSAQPVPAAPVDNAQLQLGEQIWTGSCVACHGRQGEGGRGNKLNEGRVVNRFPSVQGEIDIVTNGKGAMPGFGTKLTAEQIEAVVAYTREVL